MKLQKLALNGAMDENVNLKAQNEQLRQEKRRLEDMQRTLEEDVSRRSKSSVRQKIVKFLSR
jgi:succinate dehydrogenase/fumarate reductase flavoprotein subunit